MLAGFPGETEADFEETRDLLLNSPLFYAHVFKYSERPGTASVRIPEKVPPQEMDRRAAELRDISARKTRLFQEHHLDQCIDVLFEERAGDRWIGYTGNYLRASLRSGEELKNRMVTLRLTGIEDGVLLGESAAPLARAYVHAS